MHIDAKTQASNVHLVFIQRLPRSFLSNMTLVLRSELYIT